MTTDHRAEAERLLASTDLSLAAAFEKDLPVADQQHAAVLTGILTNRALTHATLGRDEERAARHADLRDTNRLLRRRDYGMRTAVSKHIADALISKNADRWKAARTLAQALDEADVNIDGEIEGRLFAAGYDSKTAFNGPGAAELSDDPWAPKPDITVEIPEPVRRVIADHLAHMLLDHGGDDGSVRTWARAIAFELKRKGFDLGDAITNRITDITLGPDPDDAPF